MTNLNIHMMDIIVDKLAHGKTISQALSTVYSKRSVSIPFGAQFESALVTEFNLPTRVINSLMRNNLKTMGDVVNFCSSNGVMKVRGMGKHSATELFEAILDWCWAHMDQKEQTSFLIATVTQNIGNIREELI